MKKHILILAIFALCMPAFSQTITPTSPALPRSINKNTITDTLRGTRYGTGVESDTIVTMGGFLFEDGTYLNTASAMIDTGGYIDSASSSASLSLFKNGCYTFTGSSSTWTLTPIGGATGSDYTIVNMGTGAVTLSSNSGGSDIWLGGVSQATLNIPTSSVVRVHNNGIRWVIIEYSIYR